MMVLNIMVCIKKVKKMVKVYMSGQTDHDTKGLGFKIKYQDMVFTIGLMGNNMTDIERIIICMVRGFKNGKMVDHTKVIF